MSLYQYSSISISAQSCFINESGEFTLKLLSPFRESGNVSLILAGFFFFGVHFSFLNECSRDPPHVFRSAKTFVQKRIVFLVSTSTTGTDVLLELVEN